MLKTKMKTELYLTFSLRNHFKKLVDIFISFRIGSMLIILTCSQLEGSWEGLKKKDNRLHIQR